MTFDAILSWTLGGILAVSLVPVVRSRRALAKTTLAGAWWWALAALVAWVLLAAARPILVDSRWISHVHYLAVVLALCPFVAVLGARWPGARVWNGVVAALLLVLAMPCLSTAIGPLAPRPVSLDGMWSLFLFLVLAIGVLNYVPTRYAPAVLLYSVGQICLLFPMSAWFAGRAGSWDLQGNLAAVGLSAAIWVARFRAHEPVRRSLPEDRLWIAFRDLYGLVWGRRQQDRFNAVAAQEGWPLRLTWLGLRPVGSSSAQALEAPQRQKVFETLRYQLRRFVNEAWMDEQLVL
jgi:hypothetical protein